MGISKPRLISRLVRRRLLIERLGERRVLATITGAVFEDANHSFQRDDVEPGAAERLVFLDTDGNGRLDSGEPIALTTSDGSFSFPDVADGTHAVRLFNGAGSQVQTVPIAAAPATEFVPVANAIDLQVSGDSVLALTEHSLVVGDVASGSSVTIDIAGQLTKMQWLPTGLVLVLGTGDHGETAWLVDPETESATAVNLAASQVPVAWSDAAVDGDGRGVLLQADGQIHSLDAGGVSVTSQPTAAFASDDSRVLTSATGAITVFSTPLADGLELRLWSNVANDYVGDAVPVGGLTEILAFDDGAGVLAARNLAGGVSVFDTDNHFESLYANDALTGPVAIDGVRDLMFAISPGETMLKIINLRDGELIAELAISLSQVGQVAAIAKAGRADSIVVLGAAGITEIGLRKPAARELVVAAGEDPDPVLFGVSIDGTNTLPDYASLPTLAAIEDSLLQLAAPAALAGSLDADGDTYIVLQTAAAESGTITIGYDGAVQYQPAPDFFGSDSVSVTLHDGRDNSAEFTLDIDVAAVADAPTAIDVAVGPVDEDIEIGSPIGEIEVIDVDGGPHLIVVTDPNSAGGPRFDYDQGQLIYIGGGGGLDYEREPSIPLIISATDPVTSDVLHEEVVLTIRDANDPVTAITPISGFVDENNDDGPTIRELIVHDQDAEQAHFLTVVNDDRFWVDVKSLKLKTGIALDFEVDGPAIELEIKATEFPGGGTYTEIFTVFINNAAEQPQLIDLSNQSVLEFERGDVVGVVTLDSATPHEDYEFTVDDQRFEVDGATLKLRDDSHVIRFHQEEIEIEITATDSTGQFTSLVERFVIEVVPNELPFHNETNPYDVNGNGETAASDALAIINWMSEFGSGPVGSGDPGFGYDVNGDGSITALDALLIINELNRLQNSGTVGGSDGEGEQPNPSAPAPPLAPQSQRLATDRTGGSVTDELADRPSSDPPPVTVRKIIGPRPADSDPEASVDDVESIALASRAAAQQFAANVDATLRLLSDDQA